MFTRRVLFIPAAVAASFLLFTPRASAVPSYTRQYGVSCTTCHTMWGSLTVAGATFRLSGYRAVNGKDLTPTEKPIELAGGLLTVPGMFPASLITGAGLEYRREERVAGGASSAGIVQLGSNLTVMDASIFLTGPLGKHLSFFIEFPMFESKAWEFTPTGRGETLDTRRGATVLETESPAFEVAKFWWNSVLGERAPRDSLNFLGGITHLPLAYPSGKVRLAVNQYLVYERRALDYISPTKVGDLLGETDERYFRLGEPQGMVEVNGMLVPGAPVTDVGKRQTLWLEYHAGVTNASNAVSDGNASKGVYGRFVARWYNQSLGGFGFYTPDVYDNDLRAAASPATLPTIMSGNNVKNARVAAGPDATLSLAPFDIPVSLENNVLYNRESDPTGFGKEFVWWGGFHQLNYTVIPRKLVTYARYDWIFGKSYNDVPAGGVTTSHPREWDLIGGLQFLALENFKLIGEYRHHRFEDRAITPAKATLTDDGFTLRAMAGF